MDKSLLKNSFSLLGKYVICISMAFILYASLYMVFSATSAGGDKVVGAPYVVMMVLAELCSIGTLILFINGQVYHIGDSDANKVRFGRMEKNMLRGLMVATVPTVAAALSYLVLVLGKLGVFGNWALMVFRMANWHLLAYNQILFGSETSLAKIGWGSVAAAVLTIFVVPLISQVCYTLGFKGVSVMEKLVFKKKETK